MRLVKRMAYVEALDRNQIMICTLDSFVEEESIARIIDAFVNSLDLMELGFSKAIPAAEGRPAYDPKSLLKLYIYGNRKSIRSSRKLGEACKVNVEVKWMTGGIEPDFRTISDFRKDNVKHLKKVFHEFNKRLAGELPTGLKSVDGSKFQANNSKDRNFTASKLDDRIKWLNNHSDEYLRQLALMDESDEDTIITGQFTKEELEEKLKETTERLLRYEGYRKYMDENGLTQLSLTDPDSKLMKSKNGFIVAYNVQTSVDSETHLIDNYVVTSHANDCGLLHSTLKDLRKDDILEAIADKGYYSDSDMLDCLESGIIPHVILPDGQDAYVLELPYEEAEVSAEITEETSTDSLKKCLRAGVIPKAYEDVIEHIEVAEKKQFVSADQEIAVKSSFGSEEEMLQKASEGYYVRDPERNVVYCPNGDTLRPTSVKKDGRIRYLNKLACRRCKNRERCFKGKGDWKEIDFHKDTLIKPAKLWLAADAEIQSKEKRKTGRYEKVKVVKIVLRPSRQKMSKRMCTSEHPFGTIKRAMNADYFLLQKTEKVDGEFALMCLGYNLEVAKNLLGFKKLMELMTLCRCILRKIRLWVNLQINISIIQNIREQYA